MTEREVLKLALEALEKSHICPLLPDDCSEAITAIKEALAQPEHGWTPERIAGMARLKDAQDKKLAQPEQDWIERERAVGYREGHRAALAQRTWVGLTDEEVDECYYWKDRLWTTDELVRHVEAALKAKNT